MKYRLAAGLVALMCTSVGAQWLRYPDPAIPRTKDGRPNLSAPAPRAPDGKPDLSGVWAVEPSDEMRRRVGVSDPLAADLQFISKYALNVLADFKAEEAPMRPEAAAVFRKRTESLGKDSPMSHCLPGGLPFSSLIAPFKIVQTRRLIVMMLEDNNPTRQIHLDGRKHPDDPTPAWMGYSTGKWEGDTLVVDTIGFNDKSWLDAAGHPHSEGLRIVERLRRRDFGHIDTAITIDDAAMYTKPFTISLTHRLLPDTDILEAVCAENEKDRAHLDR
jgi:hypothetical protein